MAAKDGKPAVFWIWKKEVTFYFSMDEAAMKQLTLATILIGNPDLVATDMDGDTVMMSIERGEYFGLNAVGGRIWQLLAQPVTIASVIETIGAEYDVDLDTCEVDVMRFIVEMLENGLARMV